MAVCAPHEDINSACMTAVHNLMGKAMHYRPATATSTHTFHATPRSSPHPNPNSEKYNIPWDAVGRLEVGTESLVDKSKAVKTSLMQLFQARGNTDIEGVDSKNACYGGTAALLNSAAWVESSAWDGRYAIAVAGDIAVYEKGPARPTGGAGVVAMLIGPDAPLTLEPYVRATHMEDVWDFYKPTMISEYPRVDGHLSNVCYLRALDLCYQRYAEKFEKKYDAPFHLDQADYTVFHAPYNKLVQKSFGRFVLQEHTRNPARQPEVAELLAPFADMPLEQTYTDRDLAKALAQAGKAVYEAKVRPTELITKECGNSYCGSLYAGLLSLIANEGDNMLGKRVLMFSYGSGLAATLFSLQVKGSVEPIRQLVDVQRRLAARTKVAPETFEAMLTQREQDYTRFDFSPADTAAPDAVAPGTYILNTIDNLERRFYSRALHTMTPALARHLATSAPAIVTGASGPAVPRSYQRVPLYPQVRYTAPRALPRPSGMLTTAIRFMRKVK